MVRIPSTDISMIPPHKFHSKAFHMPPDLPAFSSTILLTKLFFSYTMIVP